MTGWKLMVFAASFVSVQVMAQDYPDTFAINFGVGYVWDTDTQFSARSSSGVIGTSIDFERDLDGDDSITPFWVNGYYRFTPHHRIDFGWIRFERDGSKTLERDLTFEGTTYAINAEVESEIEATFPKLAYTWSFHHSDEVELGLTAGLVFPEYTFTLRGPQSRDEESVSSPVPILGFRVDYEITPRWHLNLKSDAVYLEADDELRGSIDNSSIAVEWRAIRNLVIGFGTERLAVDVDVDDGDYRGKVADFYRSVRLYAGLRL